MFSVGASKLAAKATESALKFGEIASQKVVQVSETVGEKVEEKIVTSGRFFCCMKPISFISVYFSYFGLISFCCTSLFVVSR